MEEVESGLILLNEDTRRSVVVLNCNHFITHQLDGSLGDERRGKAELLGDGPEPFGPVGGQGKTQRDVVLFRLFSVRFRGIFGRVVERPGRLGRGRRIAHGKS